MVLELEKGCGVTGSMVATEMPIASHNAAAKVQSRCCGWVFAKTMVFAALFWLNNNKANDKMHVLASDR